MPGGEAPPPLDDPGYFEQTLELFALDAANRSFGSDLQAEALRIATHPNLREELDQSDCLVRDLPGRKDLKRRRRRGPLRHLDGPYRGLPRFHPSHRDPLPPDCVVRIHPAWDELEWVLIIFRRPSWKNPIWMPIYPTIGHLEARAVLGVSAWRLDKWLAEKEPNLRGRLELPRSRGVRFDTVEFFTHLHNNRN